jgi:hypothetical protein
VPQPSRQRTASDLGFIAGLVAFLLVLLPAAVCAWNASAALAGVGAVDVPGRFGGGATWLGATLLLLALPVVVGLGVRRLVERAPAGRTAAAPRHGHRRLVAR